MARNLIIENDRAWYLRVRYPDPVTGKVRERKEPLGAFGAPTPETQALVLRIAELAALEGASARRAGRPTKPGTCGRCEGAMVIHGAPAGAVAVGQGIVPGVPAADAGPLKPPSAFADAYELHLRAGHADGTARNILANLRRVIRDLGDRWIGGMDGVGAWMQTARQVSGEPLGDATRNKIRTYINQWIGWAKEAGSPWDRMPLVPLKKKKETVRQRTERGGDSDDLTEPLTLEQLRSILTLTEDRTNWLPEYMRVGVQICAMTGISGVDVVRLMRGGGGIVGLTEGIGGRVVSEPTVWFRGSRQKSGVTLEIPLAPWLVERLKPYFDIEKGLLVPRVAGVESWDHHWAKIEEALGIPHKEGQGIKRLRVTFNVLIENHLGAPVGVAKALMGHKIKGRDAHTAYTKPSPEQLVRAVGDFQGMVFPG